MGLSGARPDIDERGMYNATDASRLLGISRRQFYRYLRAGDIRPVIGKKMISVKTPRYSGKDLLELFYAR